MASLLFFTGKISKQRLQQPCYIISAFTLSYCHSLLSNCPNKQSDSDPIHIWLLKDCSSALVSTITDTVNLSLTSGQFHPTPGIFLENPSQGGVTT